MRFILAFGVVVMMVNHALYSQTPSTVFVSTERVFDFGQIEEKDGKVSHTFIFQNKGETRVAMENVATGCSCVEFEYSKEPVNPGESRELTVTYNPAYRPGFFSKEIVVLSNNRQNYTRIWIKGSVIPEQHPIEENYPYNFGSGLWMNLKVLAFGTMRKGDTKTVKLKYGNDTDKEINLTFVVIGGNTDIKFTSPRLVKAHEQGEMLVTYQCSENFSGMKRTHVYPVINNRALSLPLVVTCVEK